MNLRCLGEQIARRDLLHQRGSDLSVEVRVTAGLVVECIEYGERGWPLLNGIPGHRSRLGVHQGNRRPQKLRDLVLLARLGFKRNVKCEFCHAALLF